MTCCNKRKSGLPQHLDHPDRSIAFRKEVMDWSCGVLGMSLRFRFFHWFESQFDNYLEQILNYRLLKLEVQSLAIGKLKYFLVLELWLPIGHLWPLIVSLSVSNLLFVRSSHKSELECTQVKL
jgi:hypothetical protein